MIMKTYQEVYINYILIKLLSLNRWFAIKLMKLVGTYYMLIFPLDMFGTNKNLSGRGEKGESIGRINYVYLVARELYYLRMLINIVKGASSFQHIKTVDRITYQTYQEVC